MPGFEGFELLRLVNGGERYFVYTRWASEEAFRAWVESEAFTRGHAHARADGQAAVAHGATLLEFEVVQTIDRTGGTRQLRRVPPDDSARESGLEGQVRW